MHPSCRAEKKAQQALTRANARINHYVTHPALSIDEMRVRLPEVFGQSKTRPPTFTLEDWAARNPEPK